MVDDTVDSTLDNGAWLTLAEAAPVLGVSEKTVRRRAKAGRIEGRQVSTQHGLTWEVWVPNRVDTVGTVDSTGTQPSTQVSTPAQPADVAALVALLERSNARNDELMAENAELVRTVAAWQSQAVVLAGRLADAQERLALAAPAESVPAGQETSQPVEPTADTRIARLRGLAPWLLAVLAIGAVAALVAWLR